MKWPESLTLIRHDTSAYNALKKVKEESPLYQTFKKYYETSPEAEETRRLAIEVNETFALKVGDHDTPLAEGAGWQAKTVGEKLKSIIKIPDVIFVSPYLRTQSTFEKLVEGWPELKDIKKVDESRITEQDHGLALIYNDWRVFNTLHPEQKLLRNLQGEYWYRYPNGENVPNVQDRAHSWFDTLVREYANQNVLAVTHHLTILSIRVEMERLGVNDFIRLDNEEKPINCGVTIYKGHPELGSNGKLLLEGYNLKLY